MTSAWVLSILLQATTALGTVLDQIEQQFGVDFRYVDTDTTGLVIEHAESRIRPYSLEETLLNVLSPFDWRAWQQHNPRIYKIKRYEYMRRYDADGEKLLSWLESLVPNAEAWQQRRDFLRTETRKKLGIQPMLDACVPLKPLLGKMRKMEGYTVQNIALETTPGLYVFGSIYTPCPKGKKRQQKWPVIICPNGHFKEGRYREDQQQRMGTLARMGAICIDFDSYAYGESALQLANHEVAEAMPTQVMWGIRLLDYALTRKDVDATRIGVNGGSGGGTHAMLISLVDDRVTASCPVVSVCSHFDGGCPCESGIQIHRGYQPDGSFFLTSNIELAATFAPKPMMLVGDEGDWTHTYPTLEFPFVQRIYGFYGAEEQFYTRFLPGERHDFGPNKRQAVYDFFAQVWQLDKSVLDESRVTIEPASDLCSFGNDADKLPQNAIRK
ncbi:MAG: hypothetical protein Q4B58_07505 [Bacteroidales bacterium]|nr:hypothetical protein [Bacteroidales bacterium]